MNVKRKCGLKMAVHVRRDPSNFESRDLIKTVINDESKLNLLNDSDSSIESKELKEKNDNLIDLNRSKNSDISKKEKQQNEEDVNSIDFISELSGELVRRIDYLSGLYLFLFKITIVIDSTIMSN